MTIYHHISLRPYNTFGLSHQAKTLAEFSSEDELRNLLKRFPGERLLTIGEGSNLLFLGDFQGVILRSCMQRARAVRETMDEVFIEAEAGLKLDDLIAQLADMNLRGLENLSHIPGTVGASAVQNVGAYGVEAKDVIVDVTAMDCFSLELHTFTNSDCCFAYRDSRFKHDWKDRYIIVRVTYRLRKEGGLRLNYGGLSQAFAGRDVSQLSPMDVRERVIAIRRQKLPEISQFGSAGSFFKNPVVTLACFEHLRSCYPDIPHFSVPEGIKIPAAWLIEQCQLKGYQRGGARVWDLQPLVIVNDGNATSEDIRCLAEHVIASVRERFAITLTPEVNYIS